MPYMDPTPVSVTGSFSQHIRGAPHQAKRHNCLHIRQPLRIHSLFTGTADVYKLFLSSIK